MHGLGEQVLGDEVLWYHFESIEKTHENSLGEYLKASKSVKQFSGCIIKVFTA